MSRCPFWTCLLLLCGCTRPPDLVIFSAASAAPTLQALAQHFPAVEVRVELSSSRVACTKVAEQGRLADLVVSADAHMIDAALVPEFASFNLIFAQNALVLAYPPQGIVATELQGGRAWQTVLAAEPVRVGVANPQVAPVGARTMEALARNDVEAPPALRLGAVIAAKLDLRLQRSHVAALLAPLSVGETDAAFIYSSEAEQHGLSYVPIQTDPGADYGLTMPHGAPHRAAALAFVQLLLSPCGRKVAAAAHFHLLAKAQARGTLPDDWLREGAALWGP